MYEIIFLLFWRVLLHLSRRHSINMYKNLKGGGAERMESGSSQRCPVTGPEASGHTLKHGWFPLKSGNAFYCEID